MITAYDPETHSFSISDPEGKLKKALQTFKEPVYIIDGQEYRLVNCMPANAVDKSNYKIKFSIDTELIN